MSIRNILSTDSNLALKDTIPVKEIANQLLSIIREKPNSKTKIHAIKALMAIPSKSQPLESSLDIALTLILDTDSSSAEEDGSEINSKYEL